MDAEREIVKVYYTLEKKPYMTELNAGKKVIDFVLFDNGKIAQVEVSCSLTKKTSSEDEHAMLGRFEDNSVKGKMMEVCKKHDCTDYEKILITSINNVKLPGIKTIEFTDILKKVFTSLDTQHYSDGAIRGMQIIKYLLLTNEDTLNIFIEHKLLKKRHIKSFLEKIDHYDVLFSEINKNRKTSILSSILEGEEFPDVSSFSKQKIERMVNILYSNSTGRTLFRQKMSEQKKLGSFKKE